MNDTSIYIAVVARDLKTFNKWADENKAKKIKSPGLYVVEIGRMRYVFVPANNTLSIKGRTFVGVEYIDGSEAEQFRQMLSTRIR